MYQQIQEMLDLLATQREGFITGAPLKNEVFLVGNWQVYYQVLHKLQGIDVVDIAQLP